MSQGACGQADDLHACICGCLFVLCSFRPVWPSSSHVLRFRHYELSGLLCELVEQWSSGSVRVAFIQGWLPSSAPLARKIMMCWQTREVIDSMQCNSKRMLTNFAMSNLFSVITALAPGCLVDLAKQNKWDFLTAQEDMLTLQCQCYMGRQQSITTHLKQYSVLSGAWAGEQGDILQRAPRAHQQTARRPQGHGGQKRKHSPGPTRAVPDKVSQTSRTPRSTARFGLAP